MTYQVLDLFPNRFFNREGAKTAEFFLRSFPILRFLCAFAIIIFLFHLAVYAVIGEGNFIRCAALFVLWEMEKMNDDEHFIENASFRSDDASERYVI
jgi:hypothetical protein